MLKNLCWTLGGKVVLTNIRKNSKLFIPEKRESEGEERHREHT